MADEQGEKKIIIDEDWKTQVQAEKEALAQGKQAEASESPQKGGAAGAQPEMPPASFGMLISTLASEAMLGLGQIPHPVSRKAEVNLAQARYFIDTLEMLQAKTEGNLDAEEKGALDSLVQQLQMAFVEVQAGGAG